MPEKDYSMQDILNLFAKSKIEFDERQRQSDERSRQADERHKQLQQEMKELKDVYKKAGLIQGKVAEETVYRSLPNLFSARGKEFNTVEKNVVIKKGKMRFAEYDILAVNGTEVMPVEVKNNLTTADIDHFVQVQLPKFREGMPQYNNYSLLGGVGGLVVSESVEEYAKKQGLYVFVQNGENVQIANDDQFMPKLFG